MELFKANEQWANRPDDERFPTLEALYEATRAYAASAVEKDANFGDIRADVQGGAIVIAGKQNIPAKLTHWAFGQLAQRIGAPASYLRGLPGTLAVQNLNHGLAKRAKDEALNQMAKMLFHRMPDGTVLCRAMTTDAYQRIWNHEVAERLVNLQGLGWEPAMPDVRSLGDDKPPLYASDHDMFVFLRNAEKTIEEGNGQPVYRGVIVENSEVGAGALKLTRFLYRFMCGNHIIWGASKVTDLSVRHVGDARGRWGKFAVQMREWADEGAHEDEVKIKAAQYKMIGGTKEEVLDAIFGKRAVNLSRKQLDAGYDAVVPNQDGDPNSVWGMVQGLTRYSQTLPYADERTAIDRAAGKILEHCDTF